ncbi:MAG: choice-of-anchor Q domain-containing protein, partial [Cyanobacteria bacterium J06573_2]
MTIFVKLNASGSNDGSSWTNAFADLQSAINAATSGEEIWVAAGTYKPTDGTDRSISFELPDGVTIYGGFAGGEASLDERDVKTNVTILSGDIGNIGDTPDDRSDNSHTVVKLSSGTATLDGLTIRDGNSNDDGGGVYNDGVLTLKNVVVRNNRAADDGGGIRNNGTITIIDSTIANNTSIGTSPTSGGGGLINTGTSATIINSTFSGNEAKNGGAIRNDTVLNLINSTLSGNKALESGGGLSNTINPQSLSNPARVIITNSTITNNRANNESGQGTNSQVGGGIANFAIANISNSIIAGNIGNDDLVDMIPNNPIYKSTSGGNNLIANGDSVSDFIDSTNGDKVGTQAQPINPLLGTLDDNGGATETHALLAGSPAINAGDNSKIASDIADLDGDNDTNETIPFEQRGEDFARVVDGNVDIGAVEFQKISNDNTSPSNGKSIILNETFDNDSQFTLSSPFFSDGNSDYLGISDGNGGGNYGTNTGNPPNNIKLYTGLDGNFLTGQDLDGEGSPNTVTLTWSGLDIAGLTNLQFSGDFAEFFDQSGDIDADDSIKVYYSIDGGQEQNLLWFSGENTNTVFRQDTDFDGVADGTALDNSAQTFTAAILGNGSTLGLKLEVSVNAGDEDFAVDNFQITGESTTSTPGITITQSDNTTEVAEGSETDSYTVVLDSQPTTDVTVTVSTGGETTVDSNTLTFTTDNWNTPQTVTVTAVDDTKVEGKHSDTVSHTVSSNDTDYNNLP